jgi:choline-sulfatase
MQGKNFLFIFSDQHHRLFSGAYGHPLVQTPHLDALAARGTRFQNAYTNCPICVPERASLATGRYVHQTRFWDNGHPYDGSIPSWHQRLREQGYICDSIGKLHFKGQGADHGFSREVEPLHVVDGEGDVLGCIRDNPPFRDKEGELSRAGGGDSTYLQYDARCSDHAVHWLDEHQNDDKPWSVFLNFVCPHPPYIAPEELYARYPLDDIPLPPQWTPDTWPDHPVIDYFRRFFSMENGHDEETVRRVAAAYMGTTTYLDQQIGKVLNALEKLGLTDDTRIIYSSDHGECLGARGLFGKFTLYDEAASVPLIMAGPDVPVGKVVETPVSLVDIFPTALECVGVKQVDEDLPGRSLWQLANESDQERTVLSEYHALGTEHGCFMLRRARYKYNYYVGAPPQLFDLQEDPDELNDLSTVAEHRPLLQDFERELRALLNPEAVDAQARADQKAQVDAHGGEAVVRAKGAFDHSPTPGEKPAFRRHE